MKWRYLLSLCAILFLMAGCSIPDDKRCPAGFTFDSETMTCVKDVDAGADADSDADSDADADSAVDGGPDSGDGGGDADSDADTDGPPTGLGETCQDDEDCVGFDAANCVKNPLAPAEPGYCTVVDCEADDCPDPYACCDCRDSTSPLLPADYKRKACLGTKEANLAKSIGKCPCE